MAVKPTKEEKQKDKFLIDNLYALRAGLSKVSLEMDKVKEAESKLNNTKRQNREIISCEHDKYGDYNYFNSQREHIRSKYINPNNELRSQKSHRSKQLNSEITQFNASKKLLKIFSIILSISLVALLLSIICFMNSTAIDEFIGEMFLALSIIPSFVGIIGTIYNLKHFINTLSTVKVLRNDISQLDSKILGAKEIDILLSKDKDYIEMDKKFNRAKKELNDAKNFDYSPYEIAIANQKDECSLFYESFYSSYLSNFTNVLDERDWKNLDLVIFILETRRADTLKEALQQVDMYRHTEKIAKAIENATVAICNTIRQESDRISLAIGNCVDTINSRLQIIADNQGALRNELNLVNDNIQKSINATELQNALIAKSNETSEQMAMDIARIREFEGRPYGHI